MARAGLGLVSKEDTEKHRNVARKLFLEGGWVQKRIFDINGFDESKCQACHEEVGTERLRLYNHCTGDCCQTISWRRVTGYTRKINCLGNFLV